MPNVITAGVVIYAADIDRLASFYSTALGYREEQRDAEHVVLEANAFQVVLLKRDASGSRDAGPAPGPRRNDVAIKPVFVVRSIAAVRDIAPTLGGLVNAARHEWQFGDYVVCDALDPEGNVIQLRERYS